MIKLDIIKKGVKEMKYCLVLLIFNTLDFATGILKAILKDKIKSSKLRQGIINKFAIQIIMLSTLCLHKYSYLIFDYNISIKIIKYVLAYLVSMELISIYENVNIINPTFSIQTIKNIIFKRSEKNETK